jgi:hypothetical protein
MDELSSAELNQILLHELAHLRRWDDWTNLAQKIVKALFFFHPAVWWIEKRVSLEREMACDDAVLAESDDPRAYAECLVHLAERSVIRRGVALAQAAVGRIRQTTMRVAQILDVNRPVRTGSVWKPAVSLVAGFALLSVVGVSRAPQLVAFEESEPQATIASSHVVDGAKGKAVEELSAETRSISDFERVVPAKFVAPPTRKLNPAASNATAKLHRPVAQLVAVAAYRQSHASAPGVTQFVHLTDFRVSPGANAPMFVVVEQDEYQAVGRSLYRVSVWHIVVMQPAVQSVSRTPRKET